MSGAMAFVWADEMPIVQPIARVSPAATTAGRDPRLQFQMLPKIKRAS